MMGLAELLLLAIALSVDTLIASAMCGMLNPRLPLGPMLRIALVMSLFQGLTPALGWALALLLKSNVSSFAPWLAAGLLALVGGKILIDSLKPGPPAQLNLLNTKMLLTISLATSIDALSVGVGLGLVGANLPAAVFVIGGVTFVVAYVGLRFGGKLERYVGPKAGLLAGVVLIGIGLKIILQHLLA